MVSDLYTKLVTWLSDPVRRSRPLPHGHTCGVIGGFVGAGVPHRGESGEPLGASEGVERERLAFERASLARALV